MQTGSYCWHCYAVLILQPTVPYNPMLKVQSGNLKVAERAEMQSQIWDFGKLELFAYKVQYPSLVNRISGILSKSG